MRNFIADFAESLAIGIGSLVKNNGTSYCDIETADSANALVCADGTLVSGIRVEGLRSPVGAAEFEEKTKALERALSSALRHVGHTVDFFAYRDPTMTSAALKRQCDGMRETAQRLSLELDDVVDATMRKMAEFTAEEEVYIALWSSPRLLTAVTVAEERKALGEAAKAMPRGSMASQDPLRVLPSLRDKHDAAMRNILDDLRGAGIIVEQISAHEMLRVARRHIDREFTPPNWRPALLGDKLPVGNGGATMLRNPDAMELDYSDLQAPPVSWQMFPREPRRVNTRFLTVGDRSFAPVFVEVPPRELMPFQKLFDKLSSSKLPWRCMVRLDGGGLSYLSMKKTLTDVLAITSSQNSLISSSIRSVEGLEQQGLANVRMRMSLCTWAPASNPPLLARRASTLAQSVASWGQCEVREASGDSMLGFVSTVPFLTMQSAASFSVGPLEDITRILPLFRPAGAWEQGSVLLRSMDGKLMPFGPGSKNQASWVYLLSGRSGYGKSMQLNNLLLSSCLQPGLSRLPRIGVVDIGPSSTHFVRMLQQSLAPHLRHQAAAFRMAMTPEYAINPFDTPLGVRKPTAEHKAFLVNILTELATPAENDKPYARMSELVAKVVDDVYEKFSDVGAKSTPRPYCAGVEPAVDNLLTELGYDISGAVWWHIVDFLTRQERTHEATLAQRQAVPLISDCVSIANSENVVDEFGRIQAGSGEKLHEAFVSLMSSATRFYPNLSGATKFDIGEARVCSMNLEDVAKSGSAAANRQAAVMYMLAGYVLTRDYRLNEDSVEQWSMPEMYREYHLKKARETREELKWIAWDEFHRTGNSANVQENVLIDIREGRKFNIGIILASQSAEDFPQTIREMATGTFILDSGLANTAEKLKNYFKFNDTSLELLKTHVTGPKSSGSAMLCLLSTRAGQFSQLMVSTLGDEARWALSTEMEDALVRERVVAKLGMSQGRRALARVLKNGAKEEVERLRVEGETKPIERTAEAVTMQWWALQGQKEKAAA